MKKTLKPYAMLIDFVTGKPIPNIGSEENRQAVARFLVDTKGFDKQDIERDADIAFEIDGTPYRSELDLVVSVEGRRFMAIKCAAGSLDSREREILSASRILEPYPLPVAVVSDGKTAVVYDTVSGKKTGEGLDAIPSRSEARSLTATPANNVFSPDRLRREKLIFRSYDAQNINVRRTLEND